MNYISGKNQKGNITPDKFNLLVKSSNVEYKRFCLGQVEQFQYNNPKARVELGNNELVLSKLAPFIPPPASLTIDSTGNAPYPVDYQERIALYDSAGKKIRWVTQERLPSYLSDPIDPIATNPVYLLGKAGFLFYPIALGTAKLSYIQAGATPVRGYNVSGSIITFTNLIGGTLYADGTYQNVPLLGGYGVHAEATIVVSGGIVTSVTLSQSGGNFVVGDKLVTPNTNLGGVGSGFSIDVATVSNSQRSVYNPATSQDLLWKDVDQMEVIARILEKVGVNLIAQQVVQYANEIKNVGV